MTDLVVTRGVPGSGKSTWALEWISEDPESRARVNRDALREALYGRPAPLNRHEEDAVTIAQGAAVEALLRAGKSVAVDDTHIRQAHVRRWESMAAELGVVFCVNESFRNVPVQTCIARDLARGAAGGRFVGEKVITDMHQRLRSQTPWQHAADSDLYVYEPDVSLPAAWMFDLDGTLALMGDRGPFEWHRVGEDAICEPVRTVLEELAGVANFIVLMSGRDECCRNETEEWLDRHGVPYDHLYMRPAEDTRKDSIVKLELFREHVAPSLYVRGVFDDRDQVVRLWRRIGLQCFQVAPGSF